MFTQTKLSKANEMLNRICPATLIEWKFKQIMLLYIISTYAHIKI